MTDNQQTPHPEDAEVTDGFELPGTPDRLDRLWTPHRMAYVKRGQGHVKDEASCPFCAGPSRSDEDSLIVARGEHCYVLMNLYPYNPGHLLVCPYRHVPDYTDLTIEETAEFGRLSQIGMVVLRRVSRAQGYNLGMNQGKVGGAGIAAHLHQHIVPRFGGDGNFMPIIAQTKALTQTLAEMRELIAEAWPEATQEFDHHQSQSGHQTDAADRSQ